MVHATFLSPPTSALSLKYTALSTCRRYTTLPPIRHGRRFRMAVIGSGPAGFYTSYRVMSRIENAMIDMYEHLPVPFGLVRFGVAPDHPEVKNCQAKFEQVATSANFNFIGNVAISDATGGIPLNSLLPHYDAILFAYGASKDRALGIPEEDTMKGIYSARAFVGWYNGLPEYAKLAPDLQHEVAIVIGQGNVALDVARILLQNPDALQSSDITEGALETLRKSRVKRVRVVGRRGPLQAAFTIKEVRELMKLPSVAFHPIDDSLFPKNPSLLPRASKRVMELLKSGSKAAIPSTSKSWSLDFCLKPTAFNATHSLPGHLSSLSVEKTQIDPSDPVSAVTGTGESVEMKTSLVFRSIGYKSEALPDFTRLRIPFDTHLGIIPNIMGRVTVPQGSRVPGMYCAGWVKRGPTGVIAATMLDAFSSGDAIVDDWLSRQAFLNARNGSSGLGWDGVQDVAQKNGCRRVSWYDWQKINAAEKERGKLLGKEREKFTNVQDMLAVLDGL